MTKKQDNTSIILVVLIVILASAMIGNFLLVFPVDQINISGVPGEFKGTTGDVININGMAKTAWSGYYEIMITTPSGTETVIYDTWKNAPFDPVWSWLGEYTVSELGAHEAQILYYNKDPGGVPLSTECTPEVFVISAPPVVPVPEPTLMMPSILAFFADIFDWLKSFLGLTISGGDYVDILIYHPYTTSMSLDFAPLDTDYTDGTFQAAFGEWFVTDSDKNIKVESGFTELTSSPYTASATYTPTTAGKYYLIGVVIRQDYVYDGAEWTMSEHIETKEVQTLQVGLPAPAVIQPQMSITESIASIWGWIKNLFGL